MPDLAYTDPHLAGLYDALNPWGPGDGFYLDLIMGASRVLDVGCGTGALLGRARDLGHTGHLAGLDPAEAMLERARARTGIDWIHGDLATAAVGGGFDLVIMTGHVFQIFLTDADLDEALTAVRAALADGGRLAFETRDPAARAWERWTPDRAVEVDGVRVWHEVTAVDGDLVSFTTTYAGTGERRESRSTLRFLDTGRIDGHLAAAGLRVLERYGDWDRAPRTPGSAEIITICG